MAADAALARAGWQETVFAGRPRRLSLLGLRPEWTLQHIRIAMIRNLAVEPVVTLLRPYLAYAGFEAEVSLSEYDDALAAPSIEDADVHLAWLDPTRYAGSPAHEVREVVGRRITELRRALRGPMVLIDAPPELAGAPAINAALSQAGEQLPDVHVFPYARITSPLGDGAVERRSGTMATHVSGSAAMLAAQHLGLQWIPAMLRPRLKLIVVDLDGTIIGGVLGDDGVARVVTGGGYATVRDRLLRLHTQGLLLAVATKNDARDVERLFAERSDLAPLRRALVAVEAGWQDKSDSVRALVTRLGVGMDSVLVVDDNPGEMAAMAAVLRDPWFVLASSPEASARALCLHPGLLSVRADDLASRRAADVVAGQRRGAEMAAAADRGHYLRALRMEARLSVNARPDLRRLSDLSRKTNQFNTSLVRLSERDVSMYMTSPDRRAVSVRLRDRLSDSGLMAAIFARRDGDTAMIDEIAISCRALGRSIEGVILHAVLSRIAREFVSTRVVIRYTSGPRNAPAHAWLSASATSIDDHRYAYRVERDEVESAPLRGLLDLRWDEEDSRRFTLR